MLYLLPVVLNTLLARFLVLRNRQHLQFLQWVDHQDIFQHTQILNNMTDQYHVDHYQTRLI